MLKNLSRVLFRWKTIKRNFDANLRDHLRLLRLSRGLKIRNREEIMCLYLACNKKAYRSVCYQIILSGCYTYSSMHLAVVQNLTGFSNYSNYKAATNTRQVENQEFVNAFLYLLQTSIRVEFQARTKDRARYCNFVVTP